MDTLPDYLSGKLYFLSVGLNPSTVSVEAGYYFANPRNRFWQALNQSRLVDVKLEPGTAAMQTLQDRYHIGFTDLVKRPTRMASALRVTDYRQGAPELKRKIMDTRPDIAWFHGMVAYRNYMKYAEDIELDQIAWGPQKHNIGRSRVFLTPNPSPANARYSIPDLVRSYNDMVGFRIRELIGLGFN